MAIIDGFSSKKQVVLWKGNNSHIHSQFCSWHLSLGKLTQLVQYLNSIIHTTAWLQWFWYKTKNDLCSRAYVSEIISSYFQSGFLLRPSLHWHHLSTPCVNYSGFNGRPSPWCNYAIRNRWFNRLFLVQQLSIDFFKAEALCHIQIVQTMVHVGRNLKWVSWIKTAAKLLSVEYFEKITMLNFKDWNIVRKK